MPRPPLVLLHGSNGRGADMAPFAAALAGFETVAPDLLGHGRKPVPERLRFDDMVDDLAEELAGRAGGPAHLLGYSFGGYVGLGLALRAPKLVRSVTAIATLHRWTGAVVDHVVHLTDPDRLARPGNPRREQMEEAHGADRWRQVTLANRALFAAFAEEGAPLGDEDLAKIASPALILTGESDPLTPAAQARGLAEALPNARLGLWPGSAHPLANVPLVQVRQAFRSFAADVEAGSFAPGPPLWLESQLIEGGLSGPGREVRMRRTPSPDG